MTTRIERVVLALAKQGIDVVCTEHGYRVSRRGVPDIPTAEVLLPPDLPLEGRALHQLMDFAAVRHPQGGRVCAVCATPDFHPGHQVPVGAVVATTTDLVVPKAIGTDINCGMRLHVTQMDVETFNGGKDALVARLHGDLLLGTRDLPMTPGSMRAMFGEGSFAWTETTRKHALGALTRADWDQIDGELERVYELGSLPGNVAEAPESLVDPRRSALRDPTLGTLGGGNHFLEIQVVEEILDPQLAYAWGVRVGAVAFMIHTGSRAVGQHVGSVWIDRARQRWPVGETFPTGNIFALHGADARR